MTDVPAADIGAESAMDTRTSGRFHSLRFPDFRVLVFSGTLVWLGVEAQLVARGWLTLELTGTNRGLGVVWLAFGIPLIVGMPLGGVLADRLSKKLVVMASQILLLLASLPIGIANAAGVLEFWMLPTAGVIEGACFALMAPTRLAFTGELVPREAVPNGVVLNQLSSNGARIAGPALAGVLISLPGFGTSGVYLVACALYVSAIVWTARLPGSRRRHTGSGPALGDLVDGVRYARKRPVIKLVVFAYGGLLMIGYPYLVFLPSIAEDLFDVGSGGLGALTGAGAVGAVLASVWVAGRVRSASSARLLMAFGGLFAISLLLLASSVTFAMAIVVGAVAGGTMAGFQSMCYTVVLTDADMEYHGRMQSMMMTGASCFALVAVPFGILADVAGLRTVLAGMGCLCLATMIAFATLYRRHQRLQVPPPM